MAGVPQTSLLASFPLAIAFPAPRPAETSTGGLQINFSGLLRLLDPSAEFSPVEVSATTTRLTDGTAHSLERSTASGRWSAHQYSSRLNGPAERFATSGTQSQSLSVAVAINLSQPVADPSGPALKIMAVSEAAPGTIQPTPLPRSSPAPHPTGPASDPHPIAVATGAEIGPQIPTPGSEAAEAPGTAGPASVPSPAGRTDWGGELAFTARLTPLIAPAAALQAGTPAATSPPREREVQPLPAAGALSERQTQMLPVATASLGQREVPPPPVDSSAGAAPPDRWPQVAFRPIALSQSRLIPAAQPDINVPGAPHSPFKPAAANLPLIALPPIEPVDGSTAPPHPELSAGAIEPSRSDAPLLDGGSPAAIISVRRDPQPGKAASQDVESQAAGQDPATPAASGIALAELSMPDPENPPAPIDRDASPSPNRSEAVSPAAKTQIPDAHLPRLEALGVEAPARAGSGELSIEDKPAPSPKVDRGSAQPDKPERAWPAARSAEPSVAGAAISPAREATNPAVPSNPLPIAAEPRHPSGASRVPQDPPPAPDSGATPDIPSRPALPASAIEFQLESGEGRVAVRVADRAGAVLVDVRTPDTHLASALRTDLPDLAARIEQTGYRAEMWHPAAASQSLQAAERLRIAASPGSPYDAQNQSPRDQGQQQDEEKKDPSEFAPPAIRKQDRKEFQWLFTSIR